MKLFKNIKNWLENQEHLFYLFLFILIVPNMVLCFTEPLPFMAKVANVLLPFGCYYLLMTLSRNCGKMLWILFLFLFFGAFQIVLLYLFGQSCTNGTIKMTANMDNTPRMISPLPIPHSQSLPRFFGSSITDIF